MTSARKQQIAWWAEKIYQQANEYADVADPQRTRRTRAAHQLDCIVSLAKKLHFELTGKLPMEPSR